MLEWAAGTVESEIYQYRCRAGRFAAVQYNPEWTFDGAEVAVGSNDESFKRFMRSISSISQRVMAEDQIQ